MSIASYIVEIILSFILPLIFHPNDLTLSTEKIDFVTTLKPAFYAAEGILNTTF